MFDKYEPFIGIQKQSFSFYPTRYESWKEGKMIASGAITSPIIAKVVVVDGQEKMEVNFSDSSLNGELGQSNIYDEFVTGNDRLQLITIPAETNSQCIGIVGMRSIIGSTRQKKNFSSSEPYCCNIFTVNGSIKKIAFSFSTPEKLIEFYSEPA